MRAEILRDADALSSLTAAWGELWRASAERPLTLHPAWVEAWRRTLGGDGELMVVVVRHGEELAGIAPLYVRPPRGGALRVREASTMGDGIIGQRAAVLARAGVEARVADAVVDALVAEKHWDLIDLTLIDAGAVEELASRFAARGRRVDRVEVQGRPMISLAVAPPPPTWTGGAPSPSPAAVLPSRITALAELSRRLGPRAGEPAFVAFLSRVGPQLIADGLFDLFAIEESGRLAAGSLVVRDGDRAVELVRGVAPGWSAAGESLVRDVAARLRAAGAITFELAEGGGLDGGHDAPRVRGTRLRVWGDSAAARLGAGYSSLERHAGAVADVARGELDRIRAASKEMVARAAARVATFTTLHLYRGELYVRNAPPPPGVTLRLLTLSDFEALPDRAAFLRRLDLEETYCRQKWERGDIVVLAEIGGEPAGILWCARFPVYVPEIGREVRPPSGECYIHDVYVAESLRGRAVAPAMLEHLARELRRRDTYRAWALIERSNTASTRAFEKAAYASVADVIYARMGLASKLLVRPPDPEARALLGLKK